MALATESSGYVGSRTLCDLLLFLLLSLILILFLSCISYESLVHYFIITNLDSEIFSHRQTERQTDGQTDRLRSSSSRVGFKICFGLCSCSWRTYILYVFFNSDFWFDLVLGSFFYFLGLHLTIFGVGIGFKTVLGSSHIDKWFLFSEFFLYICSIM